jgi:hypothetical protein
MDTNIELRIERLILEDMPAYKRHEIASAIERALAQLLAEGGLSRAGTSTTLTLDSSLIEISPGAQSEAIAAQVAQSLYNQLVPHQSSGVFIG